MRKIERISIGAADRERLERLVRVRNTPQKVVWRARIVLLASDGLRAEAIAATVGLLTVRRWRRRYMAMGVDGLLKDATRPSRVKPPVVALVSSIDGRTFGGVNELVPQPPYRVQLGEAAILEGGDPSGHGKNGSKRRVSEYLSGVDVSQEMLCSAFELLQLSANFWRQDIAVHQPKDSLLHEVFEQCPLEAEAGIEPYLPHVVGHRLQFGVWRLGKYLRRPHVVKDGGRNHEK
jgi:hypothetical protein